MRAQRQNSRILLISTEKSLPFNFDDDKYILLNDYYNNYFKGNLFDK